MTQPTIGKRRERRFIAMTADAAMRRDLAAHVPADWEMVVATDLDQIGDWNDILLHRFMLLDLDETSAFDPQELVTTIRMEYLLQIAIFCFGGDREMREALRLARADRFFERDELVRMLPGFLTQYGW